jgi:hypothetical protein
MLTEDLTEGTNSTLQAEGFTGENLARLSSFLTHQNR